MSLEKIIKQIKKDFPEKKVLNLLREKLSEVEPIKWKEEHYNSVEDWYKDAGNGEIDDYIIAHLVNFWQEKYNQGENLDELESGEIHDLLLEAYDCLY